MASSALSWTETIGKLLLSWPVVGLVLVLLFRRLLHRLMERLVQGENSKLDLGSIKIELGSLAREGHAAVTSLGDLSLLMGESRLLELQITHSLFAPTFSSDQRQQMARQIERFTLLLKELRDRRKPESASGHALSDK